MTKDLHPITRAVLDFSRRSADGCFRDCCFLEAAGISTEILKKNYVENLADIIGEVHTELVEHDPDIANDAINLAKTAFNLRLATLQSAAQAEPAGHA